MKGNFNTLFILQAVLSAGIRDFLDAKARVKAIVDNRRAKNREEFETEDRILAGTSEVLAGPGLRGRPVKMPNETNQAFKKRKSEFIAAYHSQKEKGIVALEAEADSPQRGAAGAKRAKGEVL